MSDDAPVIIEFVGVYHADGGPLGEARYVVGKLLGTAHCALCDMTHSPIRRKPAWDHMVERVGIPFTLLHLNEMPGDVAALARTTGTPVVLGRRADGSLVAVVRPEELEQQGGSIAALERFLTASLGEQSPDGAEE